MPKAIIRIQCLCLFAEDTKNGIVHVIMPSTAACIDCLKGGVPGYELQSGSQDGSAAPTPGGGTGTGTQAVPQHTARITFGPNARGPVMDGWALVLGGKQTPADMNPSVSAPPAGTQVPVLVDLTKYTGATVPKSFVEDAANPNVTARLTLRGGRLAKLEADELWNFGPDQLQIAHKVIWEFDDLDHFEWVRLGATGPEPNASLEKIGVKDDSYRFTVRCVVEEPPLLTATGKVSAKQRPMIAKQDADQVSQHFNGFYPLLPDAKEHPVPMIVPQAKPSGSPPGVYVSCRSAKADLEV